MSVVIKNCPALPGREGWAENFTCVCVFQFPSAQITPYARVAYFGGNGPYPFRLSHAICGVLISSETLGVQAIPMQTHLGGCPQPQLHKWVRGQGPSPGGMGGEQARGPSRECSSCCRRGGHGTADEQGHSEAAGQNGAGGSARERCLEGMGGRAGRFRGAGGVTERGLMSSAGPWGCPLLPLIKRELPWKELGRVEDSTWRNTGHVVAWTPKEIALPPALSHSAL